MSHPQRWQHVERWAGHIATGAVVAVTCAWTAWGVIEMFHEGWYAPFEWLFFLLPAGVCLGMTLVALTWPRVGGSLLIAAGGAFYGWCLANAASRHLLSLEVVLSWFPVSGALVLVGGLFVWEGRRRQAACAAVDGRWWRRHWRYLIAVGAPALLGLALSIEPLQRLAGRVDDGYRGERVIDGNGVVLSWAPAGPGWVTDARGLSWNQVVLYGHEPRGFEGKGDGIDGLCRSDSPYGCASQHDMLLHNVCRYLNQEGTELLDQPQGRWRLPTVDELVRSLLRHGDNAGCTWDGSSARAECLEKPDKETPLWDPQQPVIYYWSSEESDSASAYKVAYNGGVRALIKSSGLGSCGYRCLRSE